MNVLSIKSTGEAGRIHTRKHMAQIWKFGLEIETGTSKLDLRFKIKCINSIMKQQPAILTS